MRRRIKDVVELRNKKTTLKDNYIALENIASWDAKFIPSDIESEGTNNVFEAGDILFGKLRPYLAKGFIPNFSGVCSTEFMVMKAKKMCLNKYLLYTFLSHTMIDYIKNQVAGVKMPRTNWNSFSTIEIDIPAISVQQKIVAYLDSKLAEIDNHMSLLTCKRDAYIRLKKSIINNAVTKGLNPLVKMKDSGIDWIGKIPEHWNVMRVKDISSINKLSLPENTRDTYKFKYIDISNVSGDGNISLGEEISFYEAPSRARRIIKKGDIIISTVRTYLRAIALIDFDPTDVIVSTGFAVLTPNKDVETKYIAYALRDCSIVNAICSQSTGVSYPAISASSLASIDVIIPPLSEQKAIAAYLDEKCFRIGTIVANLEKQIIRFADLKRALIDEVITGKRVV